jgi:Uma2 family endonuclease
MPWACEDEESKMGDSTVHTLSADILLYGLTFHFALQAGYRVFGNLNLYFSHAFPNLFLTPDVMVVKSSQPLPQELTSYRIGEQGPAPLVAAEVLSPRTYREGDLTGKPLTYGEIGIDEYVLVDVTGQLLEQRLLLLRRQRNGGWRDQQDADGGVTSQLGFRVTLDDDGQIRVMDARTGKRYARPDQAQSAEDRVRALEEELARLRGNPPQAKGRRRKKP